jgi:hypothetical protein
MRLPAGEWCAGIVWGVSPFLTPNGVNMDILYPMYIGSEVSIMLIKYLSCQYKQLIIFLFDQGTPQLQLYFK